jgi:hypothetical protein
VGEDGGVSFFDDLPRGGYLPEDDEPEEPQPAWAGPPDGVLGGVVPLGQVVLRTGTVFVGLPSATAYTTGLSLGLQLGVRRGELSRARWQELQGSFWEERHQQGGPPDDGALRFGVELSDGRRTATIDRFGIRPGTEPEPPVLLRRDDSGSSGPWRMDRRLDLWLWPLPAGSSLTLVLEWSDLDIPVTTAVIDLDPVRAAAQQETPFWR